MVSSILPKNEQKIQLYYYDSWLVVGLFGFMYGSMVMVPLFWFLVFGFLLFVFCFLVFGFYFCFFVLVFGQYLTVQSTVADSLAHAVWKPFSAVAHQYWKSTTSQCLAQPYLTRYLKTRLKPLLAYAWLTQKNVYFCVKNISNVINIFSLKVFHFVHKYLIFKKVCFSSILCNTGPPR